MACFHPISAWQTESGEIVFTERGKLRRALELPCGRCIGCRMARQRSWAIRAMHEASMHTVNAFVTLTYAAADDPSLNYSHFQAFMKRLRKRYGKVRFFCSGEYGEQNWRPHFHALLFGVTFEDGKQIGEQLYTSKTLDSLWQRGLTSFGDVTYQSAAYTAGYCLKKVTGDAAEDHYTRISEYGEIHKLQPEFARMSLKPGIGYTWFEKYWREVYMARDGVVMKGGKSVPPPRYYDKLLERDNAELWETKQFDRFLRSEQYQDDNKADRLLVREAVMLAGLKQKEKSL